MQVCDGDQSLGDTQGRVEKTHTHTQTVFVCVCGATEGVRKGSDQSGDEAMEEARGRHREEWEVQSEPQGLRAHSNFIVFAHYLYGNVFLS